MKYTYPAKGSPLALRRAAEVDPLESRGGLVEFDPAMGPSSTHALDASEKQQNNEDQDHEPQPTAWVVAPSSAIRPGWQRT